MNRPLRSLRSLPALAPLLLMIVPAGCGRASGPERFPTTTIGGRVHRDGRPVRGGWLEVLPIDGALGVLRSAPLAEDGTFSADRAPVGRVAIRLAGPPPERTGDPQMDRFLFQARRMPLIHRDLPAGRKVSLDIDLRAEAAEFARRYPSRP